MTVRSAAASVLLAATVFSCHEPPGPGGLQVLDWPGREGRPLALDQPLRVVFDRRLSPHLRPGALQLYELGPSSSAALPRLLPALPMQLAGATVELHPRLPLHADLSDGTLRPATHYRLVLRGLPALAAVTAADGTSLTADYAAEFATLPADHPGVLGNTARADQPLVLHFPGGQSGRRAALIGREGVLRIQTAIPLQPRSLAQPAWLRPPAAGLSPGGQEIRLQLVDNGPQGARLEARLGPLAGPMALYLPPLEGLSGERLPEAERLLRVRQVL